MSEVPQDNSTENTSTEPTDRVFSQDDLWYYRTGEGKQIGPFRYRSEAESNLDRFLAELKAKLDP